MGYCVEVSNNKSSMAALLHNVKLYLRIANKENRYNKNEMTTIMNME